MRDGHWQPQCPRPRLPLSWRRRRSAGPGLRLLIMMARRLGGARHRDSDGTPGPVLDSPLRLGAPGVAGTPGAYSPQLGTTFEAGRVYY
jgi:hypothetical protein